MKSIDFTEISHSYSEKSVIQKAASDILIGLLDIQREDSILDVGCGTGKITRKLSEITRGRVVGIDPSLGMIAKAKEENSNENIEYNTLSAEEINFREKFNLIFCNSAMQWFKDIDTVAKNFFNSFRILGKVAIQAPASYNYCPNFLNGIDRIKKNSLTGRIFKYFNNPFFFVDTVDEYKKPFEKAGFDMKICRFEEIKSNHTPSGVFDIFSSGAAAGYLNQEYYDKSFPKNYIRNFETIMKQAFISQADANGMVNLVFNRIYILAVKSS